MWGNDYFQVVQGDCEPIGTLAVTAALPQGTFMDDDGEGTHAEPANGNALGFLSKEVTADGPTFEQMEFQQNLPAKSGDAVTILAPEVGAQLEVENEDAKAYDASTGQKLMVTSSTGAISAATAKDTELSVKNGRLYVAQSGDRVLFRMLQANLTPRVASNIRVRIERVAGAVKA